MSKYEDVDRYEDASCEIARETKDTQRRKLRAVTFTSEVFQTLVDDQTTLRLSAAPVSGSSRAANARKTRETNVLGVTEVMMMMTWPHTVTCTIIV